MKETLSWERLNVPICEHPLCTDTAVWAKTWRDTDWSLESCSIIQYYCMDHGPTTEELGKEHADG